MARKPVLTFTENGIYCPAGDFYIDPWRPVPRALITHGHSDHARSGMGSYLATHAALPVMRHRLGDIQAEGIAYGVTRRIGDADVSFHPAGHVPGSAQIRVDVGGEIWVTDFQNPLPRSNATTSSPKAPLACRCSGGHRNLMSRHKSMHGGPDAPPQARPRFWGPMPWARRSGCCRCWTLTSARY